MPAHLTFYPRGSGPDGSGPPTPLSAVEIPPPFSLVSRDRSPSRQQQNPVPVVHNVGSRPHVTPADTRSRSYKDAITGPARLINLDQHEMAFEEKNKILGACTCNYHLSQTGSRSTRLHSNLLQLPISACRLGSRPKKLQPSLCDSELHPEPDLRLSCHMLARPKLTSTIGMQFCFQKDV
jgi:hypothetical protein